MAFGEAGNKRPDAYPVVQWHVVTRRDKRSALDINNAIDSKIDPAEKRKAGICAKVEHPLRMFNR